MTNSLLVYYSGQKINERKQSPIGDSLGPKSVLSVWLSGGYQNSK